MKAVGIVAEYNPLHRGHVYHIEEAKRLSGADFVIAAISGDFVQRGEPAILDKWTRAKHAVLNGVDLVFEIPTYFCLSDASGYARAGMHLLKSFGMISDVAFGSECGDAKLLAKCVGCLARNREDIELGIKASIKKDGLSYPSARAKVFKEVSGIELPSGSNDILAMEYLKYVDWLNPIVVKRKGAEYNDVELSSHGYASASAIRKAVYEGKNVSKHLPETYTMADFEKAIGKKSYDKLFEMLRFKLLEIPLQLIEECPSGGGGLANRLKDAAYKAKDFEELIILTKSKRYTYTRISRLLMQVLLGISEADFEGAEPEYLRVLAASKKGRELLSECEKHEMNSLPFITNINKNCEAAREKLCNEKRIADFDKLLQLDRHAADIYNLVASCDLYSNSDNVMRPYMG